MIVCSMTPFSDSGLGIKGLKKPLDVANAPNASNVEAPSVPIMKALREMRGFFTG